MTTTPHSGTDGEDQRRTALDRFQILRPHLKEGVSLAHIAQEQELIPRLLNRWAADYRRLGTRGRRLKPNADKEKRRTLPTIHQLLGRLGMPNLDQVIPTVTEVD